MVHLHKELKPLMEWFRKEYPRLSESQVGGLALEYYIKEVQVRGLDPHIKTGSGMSIDLIA